MPSDNHLALVTARSGLERSSAQLSEMTRKEATRIGQRLIQIATEDENPRAVVAAAKLLLEVDAMEEQLRLQEESERARRADAADMKKKLAEQLATLARAGKLPAWVVSAALNGAPEDVLTIPAAEILRDDQELTADGYAVVDEPGAE